MSQMANAATVGDNKMRNRQVRLLMGVPYKTFWGGDGEYYRISNTRRLFYYLGEWKITEQYALTQKQNKAR